MIGGRSLVLGVLFGLLASACEGCQAHDHSEGEHDPDHDAAAEEPHERHAAEENVVRVERAMLRDLRVTTRPAESRPAGDAVSLLGELRVNEDAYAEIGTQVPARVARVLAAPGDSVTAGQPLVELESPEVGRARAAVTTARARRDAAQKAAERRRALAADKIVAQRELEATEAELAQAEAELRAAEEALSALGAARGSGPRFVLTSPVAGTVIDRAALRGRVADQSAPLFVVGDLARLWLVAHAFERDALRMRTGATARVTFPALPGESAIGTVTRIGTRVDPTSRTVDVRIEIDNPKGVLRPGMSATALAPIGDAGHTVVAVPVEAVQRRGQGWCVFIPRNEEGVFEIRPVGRGRDLGGEVEVLSGLGAGETVVVDGAFLLKAEAEKAQGGGDAHHHHH